jgi:hypothetical protein
MQFWQDVPYIPIGEWTQHTCCLSITDVPVGFPLSAASLTFDYRRTQGFGAKSLSV